MTAEQLEELLGKVTQGEWRVAYERGATNIYAGRESIMGDETYYPWVPENLNDWELIALAPSLARKVIAAEKLVEAATRLDDEYCGQIYGPALCSIESLRAAISEYEAAQ